MQPAGAGTEFDVATFSVASMGAVPQASAAVDALFALEGRHPVCACVMAWPEHMAMQVFSSQALHSSLSRNRT